MTDLPKQLRAAVFSIRRKSYPIEDLIPLLQKAADALDAPHSWIVSEDIHRMARLREENQRLHKTAQAVVDRWDSPLWKDLPHTGEFINALREALTAVPALPVAAMGEPVQTEPVAWRWREAMIMEHWQLVADWGDWQHVCAKPQGTPTATFQVEPLYTHPAAAPAAQPNGYCPNLTGERKAAKQRVEEFIAKHPKQGDGT